ncbi:hypothetical protein ACFX2I_014624 [Malus domestica]
MVMEWIRGNKIGRGGFATIYKAKPKNPSSQLPALVAVKTTESGDSVTITPSKTAREFYNLVLEYANGGTLADELKKNGGRLPEVEVRQHTKSVLEGLRFVHGKGGFKTEVEYRVEQQRCWGSRCRQQAGCIGQLSTGAAKWEGWHQTSLCLQWVGGGAAMLINGRRWFELVQMQEQLQMQEQVQAE